MQAQAPLFDKESLLGKAESIKAAYLNSPCKSGDVDIAVDRLMEECKGLFATPEHAWSFVNEELHEDLEEEENPNGNCLKDFKCPECGSYGPFYILVTTSGRVLVSDNGHNTADGDSEWDDRTECQCPNCDHEATVAEFKGKEKPEKKYHFAIVGHVEGCDDFSAVYYEATREAAIALFEVDARKDCEGCQPSDSVILTAAFKSEDVIHFA